MPNTVPAQSRCSKQIFTEDMYNQAVFHSLALGKPFPFVSIFSKTMVWAHCFVLSCFLQSPVFTLASLPRYFWGIWGYIYIPGVVLAATCHCRSGMLLWASLWFTVGHSHLLQVPWELSVPTLPKWRHWLRLHFPTQSLRQAVVFGTPLLKAWKHYRSVLTQGRPTKLGVSDPCSRRPWSHASEGISP